MAARSRLIIADAERRFPLRIVVAVPAGGLGNRLPAMYAWLDENCGADGWAGTPAGTRGVVNDALAIYFADARFVVAFVARWCVGGKTEVASSGTFTIREDAPTPRKVAEPH